MVTPSNQRRYWGVIAPIMPANELAQWAKQQEDMGLEGTFAAQVYGPPFISLAAAATTTSRLQLASGIANAFSRSPFETAMAAMDLDRISEGRFTLGLGTSYRAWNEGFFGVSYEKPVEQLREVIEVVRLVTAKSHTGELKSFDGKYYHFDFSEFNPLGQPLRTNIPIWTAVMGPPMTRLGAAVADGLISHPIWSINWATTSFPEHLEVGLDRAGRQRSDVHLNYWFFVTPNNDVKQSVEDARACVAFYAGMEQYEDYFAAHGFRDVCKRLQEGVKRGDCHSVAHLVPDEMASTFVVTGTPDQVRQRLEPVWEFADSMCLIPPVLTIEPERSGQYFMTVAETFYG